MRKRGVDSPVQKFNQLLFTVVAVNFFTFLFWAGHPAHGDATLSLLSFVSPLLYMLIGMSLYDIFDGR